MSATHGVLRRNISAALAAFCISGGIAMAVKTQGTELYFIDPADNSVNKVDCPTSFDGPSAPMEQIETTCLDSPGRTYVAGMPNPGSATMTIYSDPSSATHLRLYELKGETLDWAIGWSDGLGIAPTADSSGFTLPATRTWNTFEGHVADFPFTFGLNAVVTSNLSVQVSGDPQWVPKTA
jgi:hypothetical protein